jgi:hypothetical protein
MAGRAGALAEGEREAPAGNSPHHPAAARLSAVATAAAAGADPKAPAASVERRNPRRAYANRASLPALPFLKLSEITVWLSALAGQSVTVKLHGERIGEDIFYRHLPAVQPAPIRRMARTEVLLPSCHVA